MFLTFLSRTALYFAAIQIPLDHFLDDWEEEAVLPLEKILILGQKLIKMKQNLPQKDLY